MKPKLQYFLIVRKIHEFFGLVRIRGIFPEMCIGAFSPFEGRCSPDGGQWGKEEIQFILCQPMKQTPRENFLFSLNSSDDVPQEKNQTKN